MNLKKITEQMSETLTELWNGKRFEDIGEVHKDVQQEILKHFAKYIHEEENGLAVSVWAIKLDETWTDVIKYHVDYNADKRSKYTLKGRVEKIYFSFPYGLDEGETLESYLKKVKIVELEKNLERLEKEYAKLLEDTKKFQEHISNTQAKITILKSI